MTAGTIFAKTLVPLMAWFAGAWYVTNQKFGASALGLQRVLGLGGHAYDRGGVASRSGGDVGRFRGSA